MANGGRKSPRQFLCSDALWSTYQRMAEDQEKGVDELISDALVAYAQLAGYQTGVATGDDDDGPATPPPERAPRRSGRPVPGAAAAAHAPRGRALRSAGIPGPGPAGSAWA